MCTSIIFLRAISTLTHAVPFCTTVITTGTITSADLWLSTWCTSTSTTVYLYSYLCTSTYRCLIFSEKERAKIKNRNQFQRGKNETSTCTCTRTQVLRTCLSSVVCAPEFFERRRQQRSPSSLVQVTGTSNWYLYK